MNNATLHPLIRHAIAMIGHGYRVLTFTGDPYGESFMLAYQHRKRCPRTRN